MEKINITLLSEEQVFNKEGMFQIIGRTAGPTDYALQSGCMRPTDKNTSPYYTKTLNKYGMVKLVDASGYKKQIACSSRNLGIRPVFKYSQIKEYLANERLLYEGKNIKLYKAEGFEDLIEVCSLEKQQELEKKYQKGKLKTTGKYYIRDQRKFNEYDRFFLEERIEEYYEDGEKFARVRANLCKEVAKLSNGIIVKNGEFLWNKVKPHTFIIDKENDIAVAENIILSGIRYDNTICDNKPFEEKAIHSFLTNILLKNLIPSNPKIVYPQEYPKEEIENKITLSLDNIKSLLSAKEVYCLNNQQQIITITPDENAKKVLKKSSLKSFLP